MSDHQIGCMEDLADYHWVRDGALTMDVVLSMYLKADDVSSALKAGQKRAVARSAAR